MAHNNTLFSLLLKFLPRRKFAEIVSKHEGDKGNRGFTCWDQFIGMLYGQINSCKSLRDTVTQFNTFDQRFYHLGTRDIPRSTLSDANSNRSSDIFKELFESVLVGVRKILPISEVDEMVKIVDTTRIALPQSLRPIYPGEKDTSALKVHTRFCLSCGIPDEIICKSVLSRDLMIARDNMTIEEGVTYVFDRAYYDFRWWHKIDSVGAKFITRLKSHTKLNFVRHYSKCNENNIIEDRVGKLSKRLSRSGRNPYEKEVREIIIKDKKGKPFRIITNDFESSAHRISELYRKRWQIEVFFKWIKQNLKIKKLFGRSENAIKIQLYIAMITFLLLRLAHSALPTSRSFIEFVRIIKAQLLIAHEGASLFCKKTRKRKSKLPPKPCQMELALW